MKQRFHFFKIHQAKIQFHQRREKFNDENSPEILQVFQFVPSLPGVGRSTTLKKQIDVSGMLQHNLAHTHRWRIDKDSSIDERCEPR